jgi:hypothetical protein
MSATLRFSGASLIPGPPSTSALVTTSKVTSSEVHSGTSGPAASSLGPMVGSSTGRGWKGTTSSDSEPESSEDVASAGPESSSSPLPQAANEARTTAATARRFPLYAPTTTSSPTPSRAAAYQAIGEPEGEPIGPGRARTHTDVVGRATHCDVRFCRLPRTATDAQECFASRESWVPSSPPGETVTHDLLCLPVVPATSNSGCWPEAPRVAGRVTRRTRAATSGHVDSTSQTP